MRYWTVPRMWAGLTVAVLASGPSMSQDVADAVRHLPRVAVNSTYRLAPDADMVYACDRQWWRQNPDALQCDGLKVGMEPIADTLPAQPYAPLVLRNSGTTGYDPRPGYLRTHANSGAQAVQVAAHAGAARILLLGFDMRGGHWHGPHPEGMRNPTEAYLLECVQRFDVLVAELRGRGVELVNCTPGSLLHVPYTPLLEALAQPVEA